MPYASVVTVLVLSPEMVRRSLWKIVTELCLVWLVAPKRYLYSSSSLNDRVWNLDCVLWLMGFGWGLMCRVSLEFMMAMEVGKLRNLWLRICTKMFLR